MFLINIQLFCGAASRKFFLNIDSCVKIPWITSAVHFLNLNFKGLTWLLRLKEELLSVLPSSISTSACHSSPSHSSDSSLLMLLLDEAKKRNMMKEMKPRSAVEEFLEPFHECTIMKDFVPPFQLVSLKDILDEQTSNNSSMTSNQDQQIGHSSQFNDFWSYNISPESKYSNVLVGNHESSPRSIPVSVAIRPVVSWAAAVEAVRMWDQRNTINKSTVRNMVKCKDAIKNAVEE
ncbi:hypothetical protein E2C01_019935 [Portunus trituberculatus]|uniref:Uncharacterized protein n=1 Tax=Portunus trituberculatus TaxID=210409 RepID=A0A5B7DZZ1_PORTR|nr:hypothetical protein [Portunus trituberculatus]